MAWKGKGKASSGDLPRSHVEDGLEIPDHLGSEVTFDQKKRLARLAKMGIGPVAKPLTISRARTPPLGYVPEEEHFRERSEQNARSMDRRAALLEQERRIRLQEEREEEEEAQKLKKRARPGGLAPLGPVQPREDKDTPVPVPVPAPVPKKMDIRISSDLADRVSSSSTAVPSSPSRAPTPASQSAPSTGTTSSLEAELYGSTFQANVVTPEAQVLAALKAKKPSAEEEHRRSKKKRRRRRRTGSDEDAPFDAHNDAEASEDAFSDDASEEAQAARAAGQAAQKLKQARDGGINWNLMKVESVKGKVSNDNKRMTDADLERRFGAQESEQVPSGMMTESQVLAMLQRERKGAKDSSASHRRAQKELQEWTNIKAQRMARLGADDKERLVVSRR